jgi:hypothetical protein
MTYWDVANLSDDADFRSRCTAALATEGDPDPEQMAYAWRWQYAGQPGFGDAYAYAILTGVPNPGRDEAVISDAQIHSATQALMGAGGPTPDATWVKPRIVEWLAARGVTLTPQAVANLDPGELLTMVRDLLDTP